MINNENFTYSYFQWRNRQAGDSLTFDPDRQNFAYNAYCTETELLKDLFTCEYEFLDDAISVINQEYGNWELKSFEEKSGCATCVAKK